MKKNGVLGYSDTILIVKGKRCEIILLVISKTVFTRPFSGGWMID